MLELLPIRLRARGITRVPTLVRIRSSGTLRDLGENAERRSHGGDYKARV